MKISFELRLSYQRHPVSEISMLLSNSMNFFIDVVHFWVVKANCILELI